MFDRFETFATTIATINRYVQKIKSMEMKTLGLKGTHVMCLYSLGKHPEGLTATQLCRLCGEDKGRHLPYHHGADGERFCALRGVPGKAGLPVPNFPDGKRKILHDLHQ